MYSKEPIEIWLDRNLFYMKIESEGMKEHILDGVPVFILGRVFVIQKWSMEIEEQREKISSIPVWIKLWHLPKELIGEEEDDKCISFMASLIGTTYCMDMNTKKRRKLNFYMSVSWYRRSKIFQRRWQWMSVGTLSLEWNTNGSPQLANIIKFLGIRLTLVNRVLMTEMLVP